MQIIFIEPLLGGEFWQERSMVNKVQSSAKLEHRPKQQGWFSITEWSSADHLHQNLLWCWLEIQIPGAPKPTGSESLEARPRNLHFQNTPGDCYIQ